jgi:hypothetical protein
MEGNAKSERENGTTEKFSRNLRDRNIRGLEYHNLVTIKWRRAI